jgi:hypothetical protein
MKRLACLLLLLPLLICGGCASLQPGADPLVVNSERTIGIAKETLDAFVRFEFNNRSKCPPEVQAAAETIRREAPVWFARAMRVKLAYKQHRDANNRADLMTAVAVLQTAASEAATALAKHQR